MRDGGAKQPLILQLLKERRRFSELAVELFQHKGITAAVLRDCEAEETVRRSASARAVPLSKVLLRRELLKQAEIDEIRTKMRAANEGFLGAKEMEALRKAQQESSTSTIEKLLAKLTFATEREIVDAYAEYLHLSLAKVISSTLGDSAVAKFKQRGVTDDVINQCVEKQDQLRAAGREPPQLGEQLVELGLITPSDLKALLGEQEDLAKREGEVITVEADAQLLPEKFCRDKLLVGTNREGHSLRVAIVDPTNLLLQDEIQQLAGMPVVLTVGTYSGVVMALDRVFGVRDVVREIAKEDYDSATTPEEADSVLDLQEPVPPGVDGRIIRLANTVLLGAMSQRASDIHLEPFENDVRIRYRVDGELVEITPPPKSMFIPLISRFKILSKMDIAEKRIAQDGAFGAKNGEVRIDFRVSTVPTVYGEKMVMRLLARGGAGTDMAKLGFTKKQIDDFGTAIQAPHGLVFVTGPTGSGKSTTLYAALAQLNDPSTNITTVEDPVEYKMAGINQVQVKSQVGLTFATALRAFLRQDPDVLMVGEVRDKETAEICMRAALTGHLVLSTLHTNDSLAAVPRLIDMGIEPFLLSSSLRMVEAQRLVRRLCVNCKEPYQLDADTAKRVGIPADLTVYRPKGCDACRGSGYKGRVGLFEVVPITQEIGSLISSRAPLPKLRETAHATGIQLLRDAGMIKVKEGLTSLEEVLAITLAEE